ncbi:MAG: hypothetical protein FJY76_01700 [Candidatus Aenigmarchaeota archaeon]|nr:hypothetical protein [Candidatus Aenigmarchaeota archaeon]
MPAFDRLVVVVMLVLLLVAAIVLSALFGGAGQVQGFASARSICESAYAGSCYNTGKAPTTWDMPTQNINGSAVACSRLLECNCTGPGSGGGHSCAIL